MHINDFDNQTSTSINFHVDVFSVFYVSK